MWKTTSNSHPTKEGGVDHCSAVHCWTSMPLLCEVLKTCILLPKKSTWIVTSGYFIDLCLVAAHGPALIGGTRCSRSPPTFHWFPRLHWLGWSGRRSARGRREICSFQSSKKRFKELPWIWLNTSRCRSRGPHQLNTDIWWHNFVSLENFSKQSTNLQQQQKYNNQEYKEIMQYLRYTFVFSYSI